MHLTPFHAVVTSVLLGLSVAGCATAPRIDPATVAIVEWHAGPSPFPFQPPEGTILAVDGKDLHPQGEANIGAEAGGELVLAPGTHNLRYFSWQVGSRSSESSSLHVGDAGRPERTIEVVAGKRYRWNATSGTVQPIQ